MRIVFLIFSCALLLCVLLINQPGQLVSETGINAFPKNGKVLGASEQAGDLSLIDLLGVAGSLPVATAAKVREPNRIKAARDIKLESGYGFVLDIKSGKPLFSQDADRQVPIASITKLATALVFLEHNPGWEEIYRVKENDIVEGGRIYIQAGEKIRIKDLFYLSLVASANSATRALASATGLEKQEFVALMNVKVAELGLVNTKFEDVVGFSNNNLSTAREVASLAQVAMGVEEIASALSRESYEFSPRPGKIRTARSTDNLLATFQDTNININGGKTGHTQSAGYCLTSKFTTREGNEFITVFLGGEDNWDRFNETKKLARWTYNSYEW